MFKGVQTFSFKKIRETLQNQRFSYLQSCRRPESNRYGYHYPRDFKSRASASSATAAFVKMLIILNDPEETRTLDLRRDRATL